MFALLVGELRDEFTLRRGPPWLRCQSGRFRSLRGTRVQRRCDGRGGSCGADWAAGDTVRLLLGRELRPRRCPRYADACEPHPLRAELGLRHTPGSLDRIQERIAAGESEGVLIDMGPKPGSPKSRSRNGARHQTVPARRQRPHDGPRGSDRRALGLADRNASPASPSPPCSSPDPRPRLSSHRSRLGRRSNSRRTCPRPRRPRPLRPRVRARTCRPGAANWLE